VVRELLHREIVTTIYIPGRVVQAVTNGIDYMKLGLIQILVAVRQPVKDNQLHHQIKLNGNKIKPPKGGFLFKLHY